MTAAESADLPRATWELDRERFADHAIPFIDGAWVALCPACREVLVEIPRARNVSKRAMAAWAPGDLIPWSETGQRTKPWTVLRVPARTPHPATGLHWYVVSHRNEDSAREHTKGTPRSRAAERGQNIRLPAVVECGVHGDCLVDFPPREADTTQVT